MRENTLLNAYAVTYEDATKLRLATNNRMRCYLRDSLPKEQWGEIDFSDEKLSDEKVIAMLPINQMDFVKLIENFETSIQKYMHKEVAKHYLYPWVTSTRGIKDNIAGKLLSNLPALDNFPTVSHLWSYCGMDGEGWKKRPHSWALTSVCWLIAEQIQKTPVGKSKYRIIYDERKEYERAKPPCAKCLEKGNLERCSDAHINNRTRRYAVKMFLKDLWLENKKYSGSIPDVNNHMQSEPA